MFFLGYKVLSQLGSQQGSLLTAKVLGKGNTAGGITLLQPFSGLTSLATTAGMCEEVMSNCLNIHMTKKAVSQPFFHCSRSSYIP